jgi:hypothetical protein
MRLYPPKGIITQQEMYLMTMMGGNRIDLQKQWMFTIFDKEIMQNLYGPKFSTS